MDNNLTYKDILASIIGKRSIPNKNNNMACEACSTKFTLFKRKKQCNDCLRFYCTDCVIRRVDRVLSCDNCSMLSRRPLIRSQVLKMKSKDLKQYLIAKKVSLRGCVEKEDLVNILMRFANGVEAQPNNERTESVHGSSRPPPPPSPRRSRSPPGNVREMVESPESDHEPFHEVSRRHNVHIEEVVLDEDSSSVHGPEPLITEHDHDEESQGHIRTTHNLLDYNVPNSSSRRSFICEEINSDDDSLSRAAPVSSGSRSEEGNITSEGERNSNNVPANNPISSKELPNWTGNIKITDVKKRTDLEYLNVKQLKELLSANRVDFRGCVERFELLDRASRLWDAHQQSQNDVNAEGLYDESLCKICWDSPIECVILECGHMACCINCGKQMNECPICRQYVIRVVRFFKA